MRPDLAKRRASLRARAHLLRAVGFRHAWRRLRANRQHRRVLLDRAPRVAREMWREAAVELGANTRELAPALLEFTLNGRTTRIQGQRTPFADLVSREIANDKPLAYQLLAEVGLPVPAHVVVDAAHSGAMTAVLDRLPPPWVVKPVHGGGGDGVTGAITTPEQLARALVHASRFQARALVEHEADGDSYRLLLLDGELLDVLRRPRPRVTGDGRSTVDELIFQEYAARIVGEGPSGLKHFVVDLDCLFTLKRAGKSLDIVLAEGESIIVKTATNYNGPEQTETVRNRAASPAIDAARRAAETLRVRLAGVDIVTSDISQSLEETGGVILEVNPVPGLTHHYNVADADGATRIAVPILRALLEGRAGP